MNSHYPSPRWGLASYAPCWGRGQRASPRISETIGRIGKIQAALERALQIASYSLKGLRQRKVFAVTGRHMKFETARRGKSAAVSSAKKQKIDSLSSTTFDSRRSMA